MLRDASQRGRPLGNDACALRCDAPQHEGQNRAAPHKPNTTSMGWLRFSRSSAVCVCRRLVIGLSPDRIATYCLPPTSNVIGGALKPVPTLIFHKGSSVVSS